jgi:hypothetical protein
MLFKLLSYSLLFPNFRWFVLAAQPARALDVGLLVRWCQGMCHLSWNHSPTLLNTSLRRRIPLRSWSWYLREKKLNNCRRTMAIMMTTTTTTIMRKKKKKTTRLRKKKKAMRLRKKKATMEKMKMMRTTLL